VTIPEDKCCFCVLSGPPTKSRPRVLCFAQSSGMPPEVRRFLA